VPLYFGFTRLYKERQIHYFQNQKKDNRDSRRKEGVEKIKE
jgi:hypothetical protein